MKPSAKRIAARWPGKETPDLEGMGDALDDLAADEREIEVIETNIADLRQAKVASGRRRLDLVNTVTTSLVVLMANMGDDPALRSRSRTLRNQLKLLLGDVQD